MMVEELRSGTNKVAGVLYDASEMVVYLGDYGDQANLPVEFKAWMSNEVSRQKVAGESKTIRYVLQSE